MRKLNLPGTYWRGLAAQCAQKKPWCVFVFTHSQGARHVWLRQENVWGLEENTIPSTKMSRAVDGGPKGVAGIWHHPRQLPRSAFPSPTWCRLGKQRHGGFQFSGQWRHRSRHFQCRRSQDGPRFVHRRHPTTSRHNCTSGVVSNPVFLVYLSLRFVCKSLFFFGNSLTNEKVTTLYNGQVSVSPTAPHQSIKGWQVVFMAHLPALSVKTFRVYLCSDEPDRSNAPRKKTQVYCLNSCSDLESQSQKFMSVNQLPAQVAQLESHRYLLTFDPETWRLSKVKDKLSGTEHSLKVTLSAYPTQVSLAIWCP